MFCSKCGKTLPFDAVNCPSCGLAVGESRFEGSPYTSAQAHILPGDDVHQVLTRNYTPVNYTRTNYTGDPHAAEQGDVDARTTYRPTYDGDIVPEEMRRDMRAAVKAASDEETDAETPAADAPAAETPSEEEETPAFSLDDLPEDGIISYGSTGADDELKLEDLDLSQFRAKPIESVGQSGISEDVSEMMQELETEPQRRVRGFGRRRPVYDDYVEDTESYDAPVSGEPMPEGAEQSEVFDDIDEEEFDEMRHSTFGLKQLLKIVIAVVVVAALIVGGVMWFNYIRDNQSAAPIENVSEQLYLDGVALIRTHASTDHVNKVLTDYQASNDLVTLQTQLNGFAAAVSALQPAEATENEKIFVEALTKIEANITNCIISDAIAVGANDADAVAESDSRWKIVNDSIAMLEAASSTAELTAIINGEVVDVTEQKPDATPTPEPKVNYNTLSKGDKSDEVVDMQSRLIELGYLNEKADGSFGSKTQTAVKIFQQVAGLPVTGIADSDTLNALYAADAPKAG